MEEYPVEALLQVLHLRHEALHQRGEGLDLLTQGRGFSHLADAIRAEQSRLGSRRIFHECIDSHLTPRGSPP